MWTRSSSFLLQRNKKVACCVFLLYGALNELIPFSVESSLQISTEMRHQKASANSSRVSPVCVFMRWQSSHSVLGMCVYMCNVMFLAYFAEAATETVGVLWPINKEPYVLSWVIVVAYVWLGGMFVEAVSGCVHSVNCACMLLGSKGRF